MADVRLQSPLDYLAGVDWATIAVLASLCIYLLAAAGAGF